MVCEGCPYFTENPVDNHSMCLQKDVHAHMMVNIDIALNMLLNGTPNEEGAELIGCTMDGSKSTVENTWPVSFDPAIILTCNREPVDGNPTEPLP